MNSLTGKTAFITGSSRGIGKAIALRLAKEGANIVIAAKSVGDPSQKLPGTIYSVAEEIEAMGGKALPMQVDIRDENIIADAVKKAAETFGGIDILINNASAIFLAPTPEMPMKRFDLLFSVNVRGTFACSQACIPYLKKSSNPHILNLSPPLNMNPKWFKDYLAYTMSKYGMSMCTLGMSAEFAKDGIAVNSLWPKTSIATAAIQTFFPPEVYNASRTPEILADAAYHIVTQNSRTVTGNFFIDEEVLTTAGITDFAPYALDPSKPTFKDFFLD